MSYGREYVEDSLIIISALFVQYRLNYSYYSKYHYLVFAIWLFYAEHQLSIINIFCR